MKVGDVFKHFRSNYEVVAVFRDSGKEFYVAKRKKRNGITSYSHVFTYSNNDLGKELIEHV